MEGAITRAEVVIRQLFKGISVIVNIPASINNNSITNTIKLHHQNSNNKIYINYRISLPVNAKKKEKKMKVDPQSRQI